MGILTGIIINAAEISSCPNTPLFVFNKAINCIVRNRVGVIVFLLQVCYMPIDQIVNKNSGFCSNPKFIVRSLNEISYKYFCFISIIGEYVFIVIRFYIEELRALVGGS